MTRDARPILKREIEIAYKHTKSANAAARYLGVAYNTFKKYADLYGIFKKNPHGWGIPRPKMLGSSGIKDILAGKHPRYPNKKLRVRIIRMGLLPLKCVLCGYDQLRMDGMAPLTLYFRDGDITNKKLDNIELRCYNCMYLTTGKVDNDIAHMNPRTFEEDIDAQWTSEVPTDWTTLQKEIQDEIAKEKSKEEA